MSNRYQPRRPGQTRRLDPVIYRRRRIVFGGGAILIIVLIWTGISSIFGAASNPSQTVGSALAAGQPCAPGAVVVTANIGDGTTDKASFGSNEVPYLAFTLQNVGAVSCTFAAGSDVAFYEITSGAETIWTSQDCKSERSPTTVTLEPGKAVKSSPSAWGRVSSSSAGGCSDGQPAVAAGGASYHLVATVNGVISKDVQFVLN